MKFHIQYLWYPSRRRKYLPRSLDKRERDEDYLHYKDYKIAGKCHGFYERGWMKYAKRLCIAIYLLAVTFSLLNFKTDCQIKNPEDLLINGDTKTNHCVVHLSKLGTADAKIYQDHKLHNIKYAFPNVKLGGVWQPRDCIPQQRLAVIIPYRNRAQHLHVLLARLHEMLQRQKLKYRIFVVEQAGTADFNRGKLRNIGYIESLKMENFDCFVFHDVDLIPENDQNLYMCDGSIRQLSSAIDEWRYHVIYYNSAGGVMVFSKETFQMINGYPNLYWVWGGEDDELCARAKHYGVVLTRPSEDVGKYKAIPHTKSPHADALFTLSKWRHRLETDGLTSLPDTYRVTQLTEYELYTNISVDVGMVPETRVGSAPFLWWADWQFVKWYFGHFYP